MKSLTEKCVISGSGVVLSVVVFASPGEASTIQSFFIDVTEGGLIGQTFSGSFSFDETLLSGSGPENLSAGDGLTLRFDFLGAAYTEADDFGFSTGLFPSVSFTDGLFSGLSYVVDDGDIFFAIDEGTQQGFPGGSFEYELGPIDAVTDMGKGSLRAADSARVPEPAVVLGLLAVSGIGLAHQKP